MSECAAICHRLGSLSIVLAFVVIWANSPLSQTITDGDTLKQGGIIYRLWGIDAPEAKQVCPDGWPAGSLAATRLQALTAGRSIVCQEKDRDRYGRIVAICRASGRHHGTRGIGLDCLQAETLPSIMALQRLSIVLIC